MKILRLVFTFIAFAAAATAHAQESVDPAEVVRKVTSDVLSVVQEHRGTYETNPQGYFDRINEVVGPHVNFERMAFLVMDATYYRAASEEQRRRFVDVFRTSMVRTYARGLLSVDRPEFWVRPSDAPADAQMVTIRQEMRAGPNRFELAYSMRKEADGRWLLVNAVIDGINLGSTFRNQFARSAQSHDGDIDRVIDSWLAEI